MKFKLPKTRPGALVKSSFLHTHRFPPIMHSTRIIKHLLIWITILFGFIAIPSVSAPIRAGVNLICVQTTWQNILIFYGVNYLAHAGTVPTPAGAKWSYTLQWTLMAFCLPYAGLGRSVALIYRRLMFGRKNKLHRARESNALVALARAKDWKPLEGQEEPPNFRFVLTLLTIHMRMLKDVLIQTVKCWKQMIHMNMPPAPVQSTDIWTTHLGIDGLWSPTTDPPATRYPCLLNGMISTFP
jgi:hypothetical protein